MEGEKTESLIEMYCHACEDVGVLPNSGLSRIFSETTLCLSSIGVMQFERNFLGDRGILPLLTILTHATSLHTLNLRENGIGNEGVTAICRALHRHPSLRVLELSGNPFTYLAARQLVCLCEENPSLCSIGMEKTLMTETLKECVMCRLQNALKRRGKRKRPSAVLLTDKDQTGGVDVVMEKTVEAPLIPELTSNAVCFLDPTPPSTRQSSVEPPTNCRVEDGGEFKENTSTELIEDASPQPTLEALSMGDQKKYAIWMDMDDETENVTQEYKNTMEVNEGVNEKDSEKQTENVTTTTTTNTNNNNNNNNITVGGEETDVLTTSPQVNEGVLSFKDNRQLDVSEQLETQEENLVWQDVDVDAPLITHVSSRKRLSSKYHSDERIDLIGNASGVSSLSLEVRAAVARGKLDELESLTKEDEFLDLFCASGIE